MANAADAVKEQEKLIRNLGDKVSEEVRKKELDTLNDILSEQRAYEESLARFEEMKLQ